MRIVDSTGIAPLRVKAQRGRRGIFGVMIWMLFLRFIVPVLGVFYGTSLIADEVEDKTITYLFTRPIRRGAVVVGKYMAYLVCTTLVVLPAVMLVYFLMVPFRQIPASFIVALDRPRRAGARAGGLRGAVRAGRAVMKRPLVVGLVFAFGWEQFALIMPGYVRRFTLMYYIQSLVPHAMPTRGDLSLLQAFFTRRPVGCRQLALAVAIAVSLALAGRVVERREYVLDSSEGGPFPVAKPP